MEGFVLVFAMFFGIIISLLCIILVVLKNIDNKLKKKCLPNGDKK